MRPDRSLAHCRILVIEDEYLIADELTSELEGEGAVVVGPVANLAGALALLDAEPALDGAILDINLGGETAYPAADRLIDRGVPLVFTTGYDARVLPERFAHIPRCEKPVNLAGMLSTLARALHA